MNNSPSMVALTILGIFMIVSLMIIDSTTNHLKVMEKEKQQTFEHIRKVGGGDWIVDPVTHQATWQWADERLPEKAK